jgi:hypothetical protein
MGAEMKTTPEPTFPEGSQAWAMEQLLQGRRITSSQWGTDAFAELHVGFGSIVGRNGTAISNLGNGTFWLYDSPGEVVSYWDAMRRVIEDCTVVAKAGKVSLFVGDAGVLLQVSESQVNPEPHVVIDGWAKKTWEIHQRIGGRL